MTNNRRNAFTLVELLVVIGILTILAAMLLPALQKAVHAARTVSCLSQHKQWGIGFMVYADDYNGYYPQAWRTCSVHTGGVPESPTADESHMWWSYLIKHAGVNDHGILYCPESKRRPHTNQGNPRTPDGKGGEERPSTAEDIWPKGGYHGGVWTGTIGMRSGDDADGRTRQKHRRPYDLTRHYGNWKWYRAESVGTAQLLLDSISHQAYNWKDWHTTMDALDGPYSDDGDFPKFGGKGRPYSYVNINESSTVSMRHRYRTNCLFIDLHAATIHPSEAWDPYPIQE